MHFVITFKIIFTDDVLKQTLFANLYFENIFHFPCDTCKFFTFSLKFTQEMEMRDLCIEIPKPKSVAEQKLLYFNNTQTVCT